MTMRIMGLDYGSKTVGVAVSDPLGITAQGVETICRKDENKLRKTCARIEALIEEYQVTKIVLGLPKHMNNDIGDRAEKSMAFGDFFNDVEMLKCAKYSYAMKNAGDEIKKCCNFIAPSNNDFGVSKVIKDVVLKRS